MKIQYIITSLLLASLSTTALADKGVLVVDMQRVISESVVGKGAKATLEAEAKKRQSSLATRKEALDKVKDALEKQEKLLSATALEEKRGDFAKKAREFERAVADQREELGRKNSSEIQKILDSSKKVVTEIAKQKQAKIVIEKDSRSVLFVDSAIDITSEVIKELDAKAING
jgi:Skp family chaperone for outer membrane proteins